MPNKEPNRALIIGDNAKAPYHPLHAVVEECRDILKPLASVVQTDDYDRLLQESVSAYDLVVSYTDCWNETVTDAQASGLIRYVENGGVLLVLHNGISLQVHPELHRLLGGKFTGHPDYQSLSFHPAPGGAEFFGEELPPFVMEEEPYQFELLPDADPQILLEYEWEGSRAPAGWHRRFGLGHVLFLAPGHHKPSFQVAEYRKWIRAAADWLLRNR